ncbi:hypothetical protein A5798_000412 [Enterococcus sp. 6C8_DIV0013]|nr:hypothetical protein A5798_000412 [Enterococcus sp. 6C8_DIV0013]
MSQSQVKVNQAIRLSLQTKMVM